MVEVDATTPLIGERGTLTLLDTFEGRRMLIAYYLRQGSRVFETYWPYESCVKSKRGRRARTIAQQRQKVSFPPSLFRCLGPGRR